MNNYFRHDISKNFELRPTNKHSFIVLDSFKVKDLSLSDSEHISNLIKSDMYPCTSFYNYIVDRKGDIHELVPLDFRIVKYYNVNVGSSSGSIYIAPISYYDKKIDNKINMTSECQKSLYNLIIYILCRLSHEFNTILNSDSIILKRDTKNIQYDFYKANVSQFLALKRNITHGINECRYTKDYKNMFKFL